MISSKQNADHTTRLHHQSWNSPLMVSLSDTTVHYQGSTIFCKEKGEFPQHTDDTASTIDVAFG